MTLSRPKQIHDGSLCRSDLNDFDFVGREFIKLVNQLVDLRIGRIDLALEICFGVHRFRDGDLLVQIENPLDQITVGGRALRINDSMGFVIEGD